MGWSHAIELTSFLWHMPDDTTEPVAEHSARLQRRSHQSTCMPQLQPLCSAALVPNDEGSGKPCAVIEASLPPTQVFIS